MLSNTVTRKGSQKSRSGGVRCGVPPAANILAGGPGVVPPGSSSMAPAYGCDLIVSHRSKSPNDPFEAEIATAMNALGLKAGGGANTERLVKYQSVTERMLKVASGEGASGALRAGESVAVHPGFTVAKGAQLTVRIDGSLQN